MSDEDYMALALSLARAQKGRTAENPAVGCILVKNGDVMEAVLTLKPSL